MEKKMFENVNCKGTFKRMTDIERLDMLKITDGSYDQSLWFLVYQIYMMPNRSTIFRYLINNNITGIRLKNVLASDFANSNNEIDFNRFINHINKKTTIVFQKPQVI